MSARKDPADAGFTIIEVLTALAVIGVVMTAVTTFFVKSMNNIDYQGGRQAAIQVASNAMSQMRNVAGSQVLTLINSPSVTTSVLNGNTYSIAWDCQDGTNAVLPVVNPLAPAKHCGSIPSSINP